MGNNNSSKKRYVSNTEVTESSGVGSAPKSVNTASSSSMLNSSSTPKSFQQTASSHLTNRTLSNSATYLPQESSKTFNSTINDQKKIEITSSQRVLTTLTSKGTSDFTVNQRSLNLGQSSMPKPSTTINNNPILVQNSVRAIPSSVAVNNNQSLLNSKESSKTFNSTINGQKKIEITSSQRALTTLTSKDTSDFTVNQRSLNLGQSSMPKPSTTVNNNPILVQNSVRAIPSSVAVNNNQSLLNSKKSSKTFNSTINGQKKIEITSSQRALTTLTSKDTSDFTVNQRSLNLGQSSMPKPSTTINNNPILVQNSVRAIPSSVTVNNNPSLLNSKKTFDLTPSQQLLSIYETLSQSSHSSFNNSIRKEELNSNQQTANLRNPSFGKPNPSSIANTAVCKPLYPKLSNEMASSNMTMNPSFGISNQSPQSLDDLKKFKLLSSPKIGINQHDIQSNERGRPSGERRNRNNMRGQGRRTDTKFELGNGSLNQFNADNDVYSDNAGQNITFINNGQQNRRGLNSNRSRGRGQSNANSKHGDSRGLTNRAGNRGASNRGSDDGRASYRGNGNQRGSRRETIEEILQKLVAMEGNEIVFRLQFDKNDINEVLEKVSKFNHTFPVFIEILFKVCESQFYPNNVTEALTHLLHSNFPVILTTYLASTPLQTNQKVNWTIFFDHILHIFQKFFRLFPNNASEVFGAALSVAINTADILTKKMTMDANVLKELRKVEAFRLENLSKFDKPIQIKVNRDELMHSKLPPNNFRLVSTVLCPEDVHQEVDSFLRSNITKGSYKDVEHYLDVQFRLLREDFVAPLREGIIEYTTILRRNEGKDIKLRELKIYNNVNFYMIDKIPFVGIVYVIKFDISKLKGIKWEQTKRFLNGSLVCLSSDGFQTFLLAIIAKRDPAQLSKGYVGVKFLQERVLEIDVDETFVMVESPTYFEAYHPVLEGLKNIDENVMPFVNNIVKADGKINPPAYLNRLSRYNLECIASVEAVRKNCFPLIFTSWPSTSDLNLDESQHKALEAALTREIAVIQGPPGTGKTFLGLKIVEVLLNNKSAWIGDENSPILIVCYTNHALDQFLEGIKKFLPDGIVRVGGQSKSDELKALNISNLKRNMKENRNVPDIVHKSRIELHRELYSIAKEIDNSQVELKKGVETVLSEKVLFSQGIIPNEHLEQLFRLTTDEFGHVLTKSTAIKIWLGLDGISFNRKEVVVDSQQQLKNLIENQTIDNESDGHSSDDSDMEDVLAEEEIANRIEDDDWMIDDAWAANPKEKAKNVKGFEKVEESEGFENDLGKWEISKEEKKRLKQRMKLELGKSDYMREEEVAAIGNVLALNMDDRWRLYRYWIYKLKESKLKVLEHFQTKYEKSCEQLKEANEYFDKEILKNATIIGMTTTGAAKHRTTLQQVQPAIVIVEEAAEVLETHIVTALSKNCKHLVLIGDQQQLRPNPTVYKLAKDYNLDVSLFERLINNGLPYERLTSQHRMRPEIATLLVPHIYNNLQNHPSVEKYENISGMRKNVYFLNHQNSESSLNDSKSKSNAFEANMIVALARYFLLQDYLPSQLTILSTYLGQAFLIKQLMKNTIVKDVRCTVVDNFQGEESDIILLSLVRSNDEGIVGFLKVENRVCVALSRAKKGLYCVGDFNLLGSKAPIWTPIIKKLLEANAIGHVNESGFPLVCQNHPKSMIDAGSIKDFEKVPEGGCLLPCEYRLSCGHKCEKVCHIIDKEHTKIKCSKPCSKIICDEGHKCLKICSKPCGRCTVKVEKILPCNHLNNLPCYMDPKEYSCTQRCEKILPCTHKCNLNCGSLCDVTKCSVLVKAISPCEHLVSISCNLTKNEKALLKACQRPCGTVLSCEHICKGSCYDCKQMRIHMPCQEKCGRTLVCGHSCNVPCAETCPPCKQKCENRCIHSKCPKVCGDPCEPCREPCAWQCPHQTCSKLCYEMCDREPCSEPCPVVLECGHPCIGNCGEPCPTKCRICNKDEVCEVFFGEEDEDDSKFVLIEDCNHLVESRGMDTWMNTDSNSGSEINMKSCPKCKAVIRKNLRYGNIVKTMQNDVISIKRKIMKEHKNLKRETKKIKETAANAIPQINMFSLAKDMILNQLENTNLSAFDVNLLNNKVKFLLKMSKIWQCDRPTSMFNIVKENLRDLEEILVKLVHKSAAETALIEFAQELNRVEFLRNTIDSVQHKILNTEADKCFKELCSILTNRKPFTSKQEEIVLAMTKKLNKLQTGLGITNAEKLEIISAIGLSKGHWFKCPNGHIYAIGECGGAMQSARCPECGCVIGGQHHQLTSDNQLATEMDGARAPAYPTFRRF